MDEDSLKEIVSKNRLALDEEDPPTALWDGIEKRVFHHESYARLWKAASVFLFAISSGLIAYIVFSPANEELTLSQFSEDLKQKETRYLEEIQNLEGRLVFSEEENIAVEWLIEELEFVDGLKSDLQEEASAGIPKEQIIQILLNYYEKKLKILKRIELELNRKNHEKNRTIRS